MKKIRFFFVAPLLVFAGCSFLPPGDAPAGNIVDNERALCSETEIAEHLATRLSLFLLAEHPSENFAFRADAPTRKIAYAALKESSALSGCQVVPESPLELEGRSSGKIREFVFRENGQVVWREVYLLPEEK